MQLKGINFNKVWCGAGALGFTGEGYWWTAFSRIHADDPKLTFVTKTITLKANSGNVLLRSDFQPARVIPETLNVNPLKRSVTNKFALSNPGLSAVLRSNRLQNLRNPFFISVGSVSESAKKRLADLSEIRYILDNESFSAPYGIQINYSCPNLDKADRVSTEEIIQALEIFKNWDKPVMLKLSPETPLNDFIVYEKSSSLDAFCFSNTRQTLKGGLSGRPLLEHNLYFIRQLRAAGIRKPINGGGGILSNKDAEKYLEAGADSCFIWSAFLLRPWQIKSIVNHQY